MAEATGQAPAAPIAHPAAQPAPALSPVEKIQAMLLAEKPEEQQQEAPAETQPETEVPAEPNTQVEGEEAPADEQGVEIPIDQLEAIPLEVTIKGENGEDVTVKPTIKELRAGYMRQQDYSRKTAEVARQRNEVETKIRQGTESERAAFATQLQQLQAIVIESVAPELKDVNWNNLAANDPAEYVRLRNRSDQITNVLNGIQSKQAELTNKQKAEVAQANKAAASKAVETLERDIPNWSDSLYQTLLQTGVKDYGYKPDEVGSWTDPRAIKLLNDAYQFRQLKSEKPITEKKVVPVPRVVKPGAKSTAPVQRQTVEAMSRLQKSGRIEDAAAVIKSRMG